MILYSAVVESGQIKHEYEAAQGNFRKITEALLANIPETDTQRQTFIFDRHLFHYLKTSSLIFLVLCESEMGTRRPFAYLQELSLIDIDSDAETHMKRLADFYSKPESDILTYIHITL